MALKEDFENLLESLKTERDEIKLKLHLGSMEAREEFENVEKNWSAFSQKASDIADDTVETSEEFIEKAKIVGEELKATYDRIRTRLSK
ncbi:hypothetical protein [Methylobacter sp. YRD-M1]|uniref:hypothetical protein n=1 Tax=Methylobacter sp. YRD-M1 TaxID=2911520 RepID=UPI00227ABACB|nr:hypothetical protein [Methylobacter sp. YRD-M1]WAK00858.1 hypothetical protein LZ558_13520 [Methylobacter sp. YRD-M1]